MTTAKRSYKRKKTITIELTDPDNEFIKMIEYIKELAAPGHSFDVVVDPSSSENKKSFFIDGDGAFVIRLLALNDDIEETETVPVVKQYLKFL